MTELTFSPSVNDPNAVKDWVLKASSRVPTRKLKSCSVRMTNTVRNKLFTTLGVAGGENPVLFGIPVILVPGSSFNVTLTTPA